MATTWQQRRRRTMLLVLAVILGVIGFAMGPMLIEAYSVPHVQGYATDAPPGHFAPLDWDLLAQGDWSRDSVPVVPQRLRTLDNTPVMIKGFALPLHEAGEADTLFLAKYPRGCYFCNPPGIAEIAIVKVAGGKKVPLLNRPICVYGTFQAATGSEDDEGLYTISDAVLVIKRGF
ncbi:MAG: DUF3299 domain-containing protein [Armatimonadota bacterium]